MTYTLRFDQIDLAYLPQVGGKNASLGEMFQKLSSKGILVPDGFAVTADAYRELLSQNDVRSEVERVLSELDEAAFSNLSQVGKAIRDLIMECRIPEEAAASIRQAYRLLVERTHVHSVAVRSSATAEDLPHASFAGLHETYLNITDEESLLNACLRCYASLFTDRAIKYREDMHFDHMEVALSIGVQQMVRADVGSAGVAFTIDPETGLDSVIIIDGAWGLGENVVQGTVNPDEFTLYKRNLREGRRAVIDRKLGRKQKKMIYAEGTDHEVGATLVNVDTTQEERDCYVLTSEEVTHLGQWCLMIENHYGRAMDIEWAKDGLDGQLYIVQARPETVHALRDPHIVHTYELKERGRLLASGIALGSKITSGNARILHSPAEADKLLQGEVLVTDMTNPDWDPIMHKASAIVTNKGGRTSHAAIVAREMGIAAIVGAGNATEAIADGQLITVSCAEGQEGRVYDGRLKWEGTSINTREVKLPQTDVMMILGDPSHAFRDAFLPSAGIGLMRLEFVINNSIRIHPMALVRFDELEDEDARKEIERLTMHHKDKETYFIEKLAEAVATVAAAFYPREVIVRLSDFKTNEYANLIGGKQFEPHEENPMLGFRGASRYYSDLYREGFRLECEAMQVVRNEMGFTNVKLMIPFCRTVEEGRKVIGLMADYGLRRGDNGLEVYVMVEIPSNVILAEEFAKVFDGFSIGSNDLTQLTLGLDRDSGLVSHLFDENDESVKQMISKVIRVAKSKGRKIGLCGQAPSDFPEFARFLVECGIDSISFNPDALLRGIENVNVAEKRFGKGKARVARPVRGMTVG